MGKSKVRSGEKEKRILQLEEELEKCRRKNFHGHLAKGIENGAKQDDRKFRMFFDNLTEAISLHKMITDESGRITDFTYEELNPAREKMINLTFEELKNKTVRQVNPDIADGFIENYGVVATTGTPLNFEFFSRTFNRHLKVKVFSPEYGYVATIIEDISEQKQAEDMLGKTLEKYRTIFENSIEGIILIDDSGTIIEWNKFIENKTGFSKSAATGKKLWEVQYSLLTEDWKVDYTVDYLQETWMNLVVNLPENETFKAEGKYLDKDGALVFTEDIICPMSLAGKRFICVIQHDITERRNAEQELIINGQKLKQLNATKDKLFSIIAHDLRSPFNSILGYSRILRENLRLYQIEESEKYLDIINSSALNTFNLLVNLLNWAQNQTGQTNFNPEVLSLQHVIEEVVDITGSSAKIKNITVTHNLPGKIMVNADKNMLKTILQNLISNAVKFTKPGGKIRICAVPDSGYAEISVSDNGIGIRKSIVKNLFFIDTELSTAGTHSEPGSGLGLVICREFVEKHGGKIWVESKTGKGSNFKFSIPMII